MAFADPVNLSILVLHKKTVQQRQICYSKFIVMLELVGLHFYTVERKNEFLNFSQPDLQLIILCFQVSPLKQSCQRVSDVQTMDLILC